MASFNKLTIGNQTFDVSGVIQKLDAGWVKDGNKWYVCIPPKSQVDYQVGQVYQINFHEMSKTLDKAGVEERPKYDYWRIETYVVYEVDDSDDGGISLQRLHAGDSIDGTALWFEHVNAGYFRCGEEYFLPYLSNTYNGSPAVTHVEIDQVLYCSIPIDIIYLYSHNPDGIIFYLGSAAVKCFADGKGLYFINLATYNQIPYERDDNENRCLIKVSDVDASNSVSEGSSLVPVIATEYQSGGDTRSITTTNKNEYEVLSSEAPDATSTILISDENSDYKFINDSYFNYQTNMPVDNTYPSYVKAEFVGNFTFSVGGEK